MKSTITSLLLLCMMFVGHSVFAQDPALKPRDIVVMVPDVSTYSVFVDAVFGVPEDPKHFIPYSVADRAPRERSGVIDTFMRILELLPGRFGASIKPSTIKIATTTSAERMAGNGFWRGGGPPLRD